MSALSPCLFDGKKPFIIHERLRLPFASFIDNIELSPLAKKDNPAGCLLTFARKDYLLITGL